MNTNDPTPFTREHKLFERAWWLAWGHSSDPDFDEGEEDCRECGLSRSTEEGEGQVVCRKGQEHGRPCDSRYGECCAEEAEAHFFRHFPKVGIVVEWLADDETYAWECRLRKALHLPALPRIKTELEGTTVPASSFFKTMHILRHNMIAECILLRGKDSRF